MTWEWGQAGGGAAVIVKGRRGMEPNKQVERNEWEEGANLVLPPSGSGRGSLRQERGFGCKPWVKYLGCQVLNEACMEPTGTTQAPLRRFGALPAAS